MHFPVFLLPFKITCLPVSSDFLAYSSFKFLRLRIELRPFRPLSAMTEPGRYHSYLHADFPIQFGIQLSGVLAVERDAPGRIGSGLQRTYDV